MAKERNLGMLTQGKMTARMPRPGRVVAVTTWMKADCFCQQKLCYTLHEVLFTKDTAQSLLWILYKRSLEGSRAGLKWLRTCGGDFHLQLIYMQN